MRLNHVHLRTENPDQLIEFYTTFFGLEILDRNDVEIYLGNRGGTWLTIGRQQIGDGRLPDWFHFGFCLSSKDEVRELYERMKARQLSFPRELTSFEGEGLTFYVLDPESNKIEVSWIRAHQGS